MKANTIKRKLCDKVIRYHIICISVHYQVQLGSSIKYFTEVVRLELHEEGPGKFHQREEVGKGIAERRKSMREDDKWQILQCSQGTLIFYGSA